MAAFLIHIHTCDEPYPQAALSRPAFTVSVLLSSRLAPIVEAAPHLPLANNLFEEDKQVRKFGPEAGSIQAQIREKSQKNPKSFRSFGWGTDSTSLVGQGC